MPTLALEKESLIRAIDAPVTVEELENIVFEFGVELDETCEEDGKTMLKFDIPANRYDLLCQEGFATAIKAYMGHGVFPDLHVSNCNSKDDTSNKGNGNKVTVYRYETHERQHIACAIIRGIKFDKDKYESFIGYQDKLHASLGRNRSLVAIGTHDLAKMSGRITYRTVALSEINFEPLNLHESSREEVESHSKVEFDKTNASVNGKDLESHFAKDRKIARCFDLLSDRSKAVVFMCGDSVMSVPPIINSNRTKISMATTDVFIEATGSDFNKVNTAVKYILYNFRGASAELVNIVNVTEEGNDNTIGNNTISNNDNAISRKDGNTNNTIGTYAKSMNALTTPVFNNYKYEIPLETVNCKLHLSLTAADVKKLLERMLYRVEITGSEPNEILRVAVYDVRADVMHQCDIIEDVAIAYGFNNFEFRCPPIYTVGFENPLNKFSDKIRQELAIFGFIEVLTLTLLSRLENSIDSGSNGTGCGVQQAVVLGNPKSREYEVVRTSLLPGILKSIASNLHARIPIKAFEVSDAVILTDAARNERRACCVVASNRSLLEDVQGPLSLLFGKCGITDFTYEAGTGTGRYLQNQHAVVKIGGTPIGTLGVLHPAVCQQFQVPYAASSFEINLEILYDRFISKL